MNQRTAFVTLPVKDLTRSVRFFTGLGFSFDLQFTDHRSAAMILNDRAFVMFLVEEFFTTFTGKPLPEPDEVVIGLSAHDVAEVDELVERALATGGTKSQEPIVDGPMYGWSFRDPDGHHWELIHMELPGGAVSTDGADRSEGSERAG